MSDIPRDEPATGLSDAGAQPLADEDTSIIADPTQDPTQAEWDRTTQIDEVLDAGGDLSDLDETTNTGADPAEIPDDDDQVPAADIHVGSELPESQGGDPSAIEIGEDGQGDLAPEDL